MRNRKQQKTLKDIFVTPTKANIKFSDIEKLLISPGATVKEGRGSRVGFVMPNGLSWQAHRPHPQKEAKKYVVDSVRNFLKESGYE